jgi:hypothetical protein
LRSFFVSGFMSCGRGRRAGRCLGCMHYSTACPSTKMPPAPGCFCFMRGFP